MTDVFLCFIDNNTTNLKNLNSPAAARKKGAVLSGWAILFAYIIGLFLLSSPGFCQPRIHTIPSAHPDFVDITTNPNVRLDKRYACTNNCCGEILDSNRYSCTLHPIAAAKFQKASEILAKEEPGWKFIVFDAFRPISVQKKLYQHVRGTPRAHYVAYPSFSIHCYGFAIDLSLIDAKGKAIDMGTDFDDFSQLAEPRYEQSNLRSGKLTKEQYTNRLLLRSVMKRAGFHQLQKEWWHYEALPEHVIRQKYRQLE
jgi:D-alanyl-D-alanine dipeptidase